MPLSYSCGLESTTQLRQNDFLNNTFFIIIVLLPFSPLNWTTLHRTDRFTFWSEASSTGVTSLPLIPKMALVKYKIHIYRQKMMTQTDQVFSVAVKVERLRHPAPHPRLFFVYFPLKPLSQSISQSSPMLPAKVFPALLTSVEVTGTRGVRWRPRFIREAQINRGGMRKTHTARN